ncbi:hypothetical protein UPYG_G00180260 [Umbra pygmaea]|uniref:E3 ubiquitin-protein ligase RNF180 n=1 Tax=Umbra pygmaea TaxID=75934 RepID=A0ABD0WR85_UMBPY
MTSHVGATRLSDPAAGAAGGHESDREMGPVAQALCLELSPRLGYLHPGGPGIQACSAGAESQARPEQSLRKAHGKARSEDLRERNKEMDQERELGIEGARTRERERDQPRESAGDRTREGERESQRNRETRDQERDRDRNRDRVARRSRTQSFSNCTANMEAPEGLGRPQRGLPSPGQPYPSHQQSNATPRSARPASGSISTALLHQPIRIRTSTLSPRTPAPRMSDTTREAGVLWVEPRSVTGDVRSSPRRRTRTHLLSCSSLELGEEEEEEEEDEEEERGEASGGGGPGVVTLSPAGLSPLGLSSLAPTEMDRRMSKRERNRMKSLRRRQRKRARWRQNQLQENRQSSTGNPWSSSEEEEMSAGEREGFICAVCLDIYFSPYMCHPCSHIFCEPCLRTLAKNSPTNTPCPLCRTVITHVFFQKELNHKARTFFPKEYLSRKQTFQKASCAKWPLPSCRKLFRIFGGFQRQASPIARRQFPHGGYSLDAMDFEDDSRGWRFDMDMVIIYIYSVNWVIGFVVFCFLCYFFFPSF